MAWAYLLKGLGVIALLGSTIAVPVTVSQYFGSKPIELKNLKDYQEHCLVVGGTNEDTKILGCQVTTTGSSVDFYLYKKGGSDDNVSFSKIKSVKSETDKPEVTIVVTKMDSDTTETVKLDKSNKWVGAVNGLELESRCKVDWQKTSENKKRKISCKNNNQDKLIETEELDSFSLEITR